MKSDRNHNQPHHHSPGARSGRIILGVAILVAGVLFLLDNMGRLDAEEYLLYWPVALIAVGVLHLATKDSLQGKIVGIITSVIGGLLLADNLGYLDFDLWDLWPLLLIFIGVRLVLQAFGRGRSGGSLSAGSTESVSAFAVMSGVNRKSSSGEFLGGDLTAFMGGCEVDLSNAKPSPKGAVLDVFAFWGGIDIHVPESWSVESRVTPLLGAYEDNTRQPADRSQKLIVKGLVIMGGVEINNRPASRQATVVAGEQSQ